MSETEDQHHSRKTAAFSSLTAKQIDAELADLRRRHHNATWAQLGRLLGWSERTTQRYANGEYDGRLPLSIDLTLELGRLNPDIWKRGTTAWHEKRLPKFERRKPKAA